MGWGRLSHPGRADSPPSPWPSPSPQSIFSLLWDVMMLLRSLPQSTKDFLASILDSMTWAILSKWFRGFHLLDFYHVPRPPPDHAQWHYSTLPPTLTKITYRHPQPRPPCVPALPVLLLTVYSRKVFFFLYFAIWWAACDASLGYVLTRQSKRKCIVRTVPKLSSGLIRNVVP